MEPFETLVRRAQAGDVDAYSGLVLRFQNMAYACASAYLNDYTLAEDAAQEAFIEVYQALPELREPLAFPAWFKRILFKHCHRFTRRKQFPLEPLEGRANLAARQPGPPELAEHNELARQVRQAIASLPLEQRLVTALFYIQDYSHNEIAAFLELPPKTVKSRLHEARRKLKQRMFNMLEDEFKNHPLPEDFTQATVERAIERARQLNQDSQFGEAETLLRQALNQAPGHPGALKELNRAVMRGQVYGHGRWDLLPELAQHGQAILQLDADEDVYRQLATTLLAIPAMQPAADFLRQWIEQRGPNLERLGMLAWASGCLGDYATAEQLWDQLLPLAKPAPAEEACPRLALITRSLVDCFSAAGQPEPARRVAQQGWETCRPHLTRPGSDLFTALDWMVTLLQAGLDYRAAAQGLLAEVAAAPTTAAAPITTAAPITSAVAPLAARGLALCLRAYLDEPQTLQSAWLDWVEECLSADEAQWPADHRLRLGVTGALRKRGLPGAQIALAEATWQQVQPAAEQTPALSAWNWERFNFFSYVDQQDWQAVERLAWAGLSEWEGCASGLILARAAQGQPNPPELLELARDKGIEAVDPYGLFGWYMLAREKAAAGDAAQAFEALRRSTGYWSNPPLMLLDIWENDAYWGELRRHPEFIRIFEEKRRRVGPIYGELHYFPGW